ncbi:erythroid membrane-associated protein-like isoform X1 [Anguilla anguilla]|uniref:erythroid membrane-associated protein-like isoform X1 n=2 Tax=Anguilla anguilla TaxID=7936 RepID=UPI0015AE36BA|nr:erythroid membrane-associated protein-like isoform X1 [Anguilla anguilla]
MGAGVSEDTPHLQGAGVSEDTPHLMDVVAGGTRFGVQGAGPGGGSADLPPLAAGAHSASLPAPPPSSPADYRSRLETFGEMSQENPYETLGLVHSEDYIPMCRSPSWPRPPVSPRSTVRGSLCRRKLLVSLGILTLLSVSFLLALYLLQRSTLQEAPHGTAQELSTLQNDMKELKETSARLISELQMEVEDLDHFYASVLMCAPNYSSPFILDKIMNMSRKNGIIIKPAWRWLREAAVDVTLDPESAHPSLVLSSDRKQVRLGPRRQDLSSSVHRFSYVVCVLAKEGFSSGRRYWEVRVHNKTGWTVGVASSRANRQGSILFRPQTGYWVMMMKNEVISAMREPPSALPLRERPGTVGVYVDYEGGQVSFYDAEARTHIYSFTGCTFTEKLYPLFRPGLSEAGKNSAPLIISPVNHFH